MSSQAAGLRVVWRSSRWARGMVFRRTLERLVRVLAVLGEMRPSTTAAKRRATAKLRQEGAMTSPTRGRAMRRAVSSCSWRLRSLRKWWRQYSELEEGRGRRQRRPFAKVKAHKDARSSGSLEDIRDSRK